MITVITKIELKEPWTLEIANARFDRSTPKYVGIPGLFRKFFSITPDGHYAYGFYHWRSKEDAEAFYTDEWLADQEQRLGVKMHFEWLLCGAVVDNVLGEIVR